MKRRKNQLAHLILAAVLVLSAVPTVAFAKEDVKPSATEYEVNINNAKCVFIGNEKAAKYEVGKKYFLTYTVSEVELNQTTQSGMIITTDREAAYPYTKGGMKYDKKSLLLDKGYTYFLRFEITENGLECIAGKAKDNSSDYIKLPHIARDIMAQGQYFGAWMSEGGLVTAKLTHVRCYDENGNDLGVYGNKSQGVVVLKKGDMQANKKVEHSYSFSLKEANHIAISNERAITSNVTYMEYTVKNVKKGNITQSGTILTNSPTAVFPYGSGAGYMKYAPHKQPSECMILEEGATYLYRFEKTSDSFDVLVKRTVNGKTSYFSFAHEYGKYNAANQYFSVWIGEACEVTADFVDVKFYDDKGNNLAIQTNQGVEITHYGNLEDYSECEAVYYCKNNDTFIALDADCKAIRRVDSEQVSVIGSYFIREAILTLKVAGKEETFDYVYKSLTDKDGNKYIRLSDSKVTFVSRAVDGETIETVDVTAKTDYKLQKPTAPKREGYKFQGWKLGDGQEYDFDSVVTESMTLYASWSGQDEYVQTGIVGTQIHIKTVIIVGVSSLLVLVTAFVLLKIYRGEKNE